LQGLVYIFIALSALGVAAAAYFALTFSPIEALVTALAFGAVAITVVERQLRRRTEARLERAVEELARLLSTDARAGQVLSQRVNALADTNVGSRLDGIEADISVLGTVVRQVAETVADIESTRPATMASAGAGQPVDPLPFFDEDSFPEPVIDPVELRQALDGDRLIFHVDPVMALPQRRPLGYDLVPRLMREAGELADAADFMPRRGGEVELRRVDTLALEEAIGLARRARTAGTPIRLFVGLSSATLGDKQALEQMVASLGANQAITPSLCFLINYNEFKGWSRTEKSDLIELHRTGIGFVMAEADSLRVDFSELQTLGFAALRFDAARFLAEPTAFTDLHTSDIAHYARRFEIDLCASGVTDEQQVLSLFEDGIQQAQGPHLGRPGPARGDLMVERMPASRPAPPRQGYSVSA
jgi:cyclic-di-GMP phosphodiesterase, flagellum assembly factor TipF